MPPKAVPPPRPPPGKKPITTASYGTPNQTLYCSNLPDKLQKQDLRRALYMLFSTHGVVLDIVALKTPKMRGQAHIVFRDVDASTHALRSLQGFEFFGKEMKIAYGRGRSEKLNILEGSYKPPVKEAPPATATDAQKSIFDAPPSADTSKAASKDMAMADADKAPQGTKRLREEDDEGEDAPMDEDDDAMDESDSD